MAYTNTAWSNPESSLDANEYCSVCLVDLNEPGAAKVKSKCKLPVKAAPGGPTNTNAMQAAAAALMGARGGVDLPASEKKKVAAKLARMMREAGMNIGDSMMQMAGMKK